jgi:MFS family permease
MYKTIYKLNPASSLLLLSGMSFSIFYAIVWFVIPLEISKNIYGGMPNFALGIFDFAIVSAGFLIGKIADRFNKEKLVFIGLLLFSISGILLGFSLNIFFLLFGYLVTIGDEITSLSLWAWMHTLDKDHAEDGLVGGVITFAQDMGWAIGPILAGFLYSFYGAKFTIFFGGCFAFVVFLIYFYMFNGKKVFFYNTKTKIPNKPHFKRYKH